MHKKNDLLFLVLCSASDLQNTDWFYKSPFSKIDSFKFQISSTKFQINLNFSMTQTGLKF